MDALEAVALGIAGGGIVETINIWSNLNAWQQNRREARHRGRELPGWILYFDPGPDIAVAVTRLLLGGLSGLIFHAQVTGQMAAIAVGAAAPALLRQVGTSRESAIEPASTTTEDSGASDTSTESNSASPHESTSTDSSESPSSQADSDGAHS